MTAIVVSAAVNRSQIMKYFPRERIQINQAVSHTCLSRLDLDAVRSGQPMSKYMLFWNAFKQVCITVGVFVCFMVPSISADFVEEGRQVNVDKPGSLYQLIRSMGLNDEFIDGNTVTELSRPLQDGVDVSNVNPMCHRDSELFAEEFNFEFINKPESAPPDSSLNRLFEPDDMLAQVCPHQPMGR
jgi:hypothetical protein